MTFLSALLRRMGVRSRLLAFFTLALGALTLSTAIIAYAALCVFIKESAFREERELSRRLAERLSAHFAEAQRGLSTLSVSLRTEGLSVKKETAALRAFAARYTDIVDVATFDGNGRGRVRAGRAKGRLVWGKNTASRPGRKESTPLSLGNFHIGTAQVGGSNPHVPLTMPVGDKEGTVLVARLGLAAVFTMIKESASPSTHAYLVDNNGRVLTHSLYAPNEDWSNRPTVAAFLNDPKGRQGTPLFVGIGRDRNLAVFHRVEPTGWAVFFESPFRALLAPARRMGLWVLAAALGVGGLFWGVGFLLINKILAPLGKLQQGLQCIGRGDFSHRVRIQSVAELEKVAETINRMAESLAASEKAKRDLAHMIVHDLKNPLSATLSAIECVLQMADRTLSNEEKKMLSLGAKSGRDLLRLIQNLLDVAKMEEGKLVLNRNLFSMLELAGQCVDDLEPQIMKEKKVISVEVSPGLPLAWADRDLVHRTLANLLTNALKHTPPRTEISIHVRHDEPARSLVVSVKDNGEGVPPDFKDRIFEKYSQAEGRKTNQRVGSGLGLTFCKLAVEAHGGRIGVESAPGQGSEFYFSIPLALEK
jgi:signal transduction histidine kinase